ncbi:MAG: CDP-glucose 4,6-dehydratase, partial [Bdellovibrionales bacterium]
MSLNSLRNGYVNGEGKLRIDYKFWENRKVLMTGHTGFKGAWFVQLLRSFGAKVHGFSLPPPSQPSLYERAKLSALLDLEVLGDIRNQSLLKEVIDTVDPDVVIHMAAQSLVPASYLDPMETWSVNVMGTVSVLEACRRKKAIRVIGIVTSDKCYWNSGSGDAFKETDTLGGKDPYSASKASAELVAKSYFYSCLKEENPNSSLITLRAGNILGGGDWAANRLIPDLIRAIVQKQSLGIRMPSAIRPWQYVLDALLGYSMALQDAARESGRLDHWN